MPPTIKPATPADEPAIIALWHVCNLVAPYNDPAADFRFAKSGPSSDVLVALDDSGTITGTVMVGHDGHRGWLYYLAASPTARNLGIGRHLVTAAETWLQQRGIRKAQLMVRETNPHVITFYEHLGYDQTPRTILDKWLKPHSQTP